MSGDALRDEAEVRTGWYVSGLIMEKVAWEDNTEIGKVALGQLIA